MSIRFDPNYVSNLAASVNTSALAEQRLTGQLASGLRVGTLSDDPLAAAANVGLASSISRADVFTQSATRESSLLQVTDATLGEVVTHVTSAISIAVQAANGTLSATNKQALAEQVAGIRDTVLSLANTSYLGQHLFSGSQGTTQPFTLDSTTNPATVQYAGDAVTQSITTPTGQKIQVSLAGSAVFSAAGADLLGALNQLASDLQGSTQGSLTNDAAALNDALAHVSTERSRLGSSASNLNSASTLTGSDRAQVQAEQSALLSADPAAVATGLKNAEVQHQALLSVIAALNKTNLFDFLR